MILHAPSSSQSPQRLSVSVVVYRSDTAILLATLESLASAGQILKDTHQEPIELILVDNSSDQEVARHLEGPRGQAVVSFFEPLTVISGQGNVGFGRGHNLAWARARAQYHLILNPDVVLEPDALHRAVDFLESHPEACVLSPRVVDTSGQLQFLCKRYPSVFDLFLRGFAPLAWQRRFAARLNRYQMRAEVEAERVIWDPPLISGCFMVFRREALVSLGGFDEGYFLYFEDYDLSLRAARVGRLVYDPAVRILHRGGASATKGWRHVRMFLRSATRFFSANGWRLW